MYSHYCSNSLIHLADGGKFYCENEVADVDKIIKNCQPNETLILMPTELKGGTILVQAQEIAKCEYTD